MDLNQYIEKQGANKCADLWNVSVSCVYHWKKGVRTPRPEQAKRIVETTHGLVSYDGIYGKSE